MLTIVTGVLSVTDIMTETQRQYLISSYIITGVAWNIAVVAHINRN